MDRPDIMVSPGQAGELLYEIIAIEDKSNTPQVMICTGISCSQRLSKMLIQIRLRILLVPSIGMVSYSYTTYGVQPTHPWNI